MSDINLAPAAGSAPDGQSCSQCGSREVRPSRSSYPRDKEAIGGSAASFWRCATCGARFVGGFVPEKSMRKRREERHRKKADHSLDRSIRLSRRFRRIFFPILVVLATIVAVAYVLDRRDVHQETIVLPD